MSGDAIRTLIEALARLPGLGPRSGRRIALAMLNRPEGLLTPVLEALAAAAERIAPCPVCRNLDTQLPCAICADGSRDPGTIAVVEQVADLWALERTAAFRGRYHVLGGSLSAIDGVGPEDLGVDDLVARARAPATEEIILALNATVAGQTTSHVIAERLAGAGVRITRLAHGVPVGGELDYLDDGTLTAAIRARRDMSGEA